MQNEVSLIERAKKRDPMALTQIYEENFERIFRYVVLKTGSRVEAEDITQQVFLKALRSISSYRHQGHPLTAWLYRIARNEVVDHYRKKGRQATVPLEDTVPDTKADPAAAAERSLSLEEVSVAMKKLTQAQAEVIALRFTRDLPIAEVARIMGKNEGAVKALQHSAVRALRRAMAVT